MKKSKSTAPTTRGWEEITGGVGAAPLVVPLSIVLPIQRSRSRR